MYCIVRHTHYSGRYPTMSGAGTNMVLLRNKRKPSLCGTWAAWLCLLLRQTPVNPVPLTRVVTRSVTLGAGWILNIKTGKVERDSNNTTEQLYPSRGSDILNIGLMSLRPEKRSRPLKPKSTSVFLPNSAICLGWA
ncbi:hypothetical protein FVEG_15619 [Fusarium verticillioides 7600]|uniref:Uncharacterized protein n=1 Tax=Gibberella moniliformis (strain M3125 / FGSC 7600) TaxID=334819 RepID=W7LZW9_GIBM7|nr:hypothetical protein FVEG_15619 [Fusarium verticillioides 7600]EWG44216.1 hypothetical protein FVEG_15619 [Fusarium verticillioides 7600]